MVQLRTIGRSSRSLWRTSKATTRSSVKPDTWRLHFEISRTWGLQRAEDRLGNVVLFDGDTIIHSSFGTVDGDFLSDINGRLFAHGGSTLIPVPATAWLFSTGLLGLAGVARRGRSTRLA